MSIHKLKQLSNQVHIKRLAFIHYAGSSFFCIKVRGRKVYSTNTINTHNYALLDAHLPCQGLFLHICVCDSWLDVVSNEISKLDCKCDKANKVHQNPCKIPALPKQIFMLNLGPPLSKCLKERPLTG